MAKGDPDVLLEAFDSAATLDGLDGDEQLDRLAVLPWAAGWQGRRLDTTRYRHRIIWIDRTGYAAAARVELDWPQATYTDYLTLLRDRDRWVIASKIYHTAPPGEAPPDAEPGRDDAPIRTAVDAYLRALKTLSRADLDQAFDPRAAIVTSRRGGGLSRMPYERWKSFTDGGALAPPSEMFQRITSIDRSGDAALVKVDLDWPNARYVDYLSLLRISGEWRIVNKIWFTGPSGRRLEQRRRSLESASDAASEILASGSDFAERFSSLLSDSAVVLLPMAGTLATVDSVRDYLTGTPSAPRSMRWEAVRSEVSGDGRHAYTLAQGSFSVDRGEGLREMPGHFLMYWVEAGHGWKVRAFVFNTRAPGNRQIGPEVPHRTDTGPGVGQSVAGLAKELLAVDSAFSEHSLAHGLGRAFAAYASPVAAAMAARDSIYFGPLAIERAYTLPHGDRVYWTPRFVAVSASGDLGFTAGDAVFDLKSAKATSYTKYVTVWRRQPAGEWKWVADLGNARPAP